MPAQPGSWAATSWAAIVWALTFSRAFEVASHDPATLRRQRRPLDRLLLRAPPPTARVGGRRRYVGEHSVRRNFDADAAAIATLRIGQQHLRGGSGVGRHGGG